jgi:hypothetical protein
MNTPQRTLDRLKEFAAAGDNCATAVLHIFERLEKLEQWLTRGDFVQVPPNPEAAPVVTENGLLRCYGQAIEDAVKRGASHDEAKEAGRRACYDLGRQHGAAQLLSLKKELERERLRLAACGVVAMADTPESAAKARDIDPKFHDVIRQVDALMEASADLPDFSSAADNQVIVSCPETCWVEVRRIADGKVLYNNHRKGELTIPVGEPPAGGLVERVTKAIYPSKCAHPNFYRHEARATIREVATWLDQRGLHGCALWLREEANR